MPDMRLKWLRGELARSTRVVEQELSRLREIEEEILKIETERNPKKRRFGVIQGGLLTGAAVATAEWIRDHPAATAIVTVVALGGVLGVATANHGGSAPQQPSIALPAPPSIALPAPPTTPGSGAPLPTTPPAAPITVPAPPTAPPTVQQVMHRYRVRRSDMALVANQPPPTTSTPTSPPPSSGPPAGGPAPTTSASATPPQSSTPPATASCKVLNLAVPPLLEVCL